MIFHCIEKGCPRNVAEGDLFFCRIHRDSWRIMCENPLADISDNVRVLTQIVDERLCLLRK